MYHKKKNHTYVIIRMYSGYEQVALFCSVSFSSTTCYSMVYVRLVVFDSCHFLSLSLVLSLFRLSSLLFNISLSYSTRSPLSLSLFICLSLSRPLSSLSHFLHESVD